MSQLVQRPAIRIRPSGLRRMIAVLIVFAAIATAVLLIASSGSDNQVSSTPATTSVGGPNEAARGNSAATASGAQPANTGGPNEAARGGAASSAAGADSTPATVGVDPTKRGQSADPQSHR